MAANGDYSRTYKITDQVELAPLRSLDDFLLSAARFQLPQFNDLNRWSNRITANLMYYQTNYFFVGLIIFLFISMLNPRDVILGLATVAIILAAFAFATTTYTDVAAFRKDHQLISIGILLIAGYICVYMVSSMMVFIFSIAFPMLVAFIHASLRMRSLKNKLANKAEAAGITKTVMGHILDILGCKPELTRVD